MFDYLYEKDITAMQVITIPKILFSCPDYSELSAEAKVLYAILIDHRNQADILGNSSKLVTYTIEEICEDFCCTIPSAERMLNELAAFGLIHHNSSNIRFINQIQKERDNHA